MTTEQPHSSPINMATEHRGDDPMRKQDQYSRQSHQSFVRKLYEILQKPDREEDAPRSIWWTPDGKGICISPKEFDNHESKKYFQGTKYFGFSRRLMRNYFDRVSNADKVGVHEYRHREGMFERNRPDLLQNIKFNNRRPYRIESATKSSPTKSSLQEKTSKMQGIKIADEPTKFHSLSPSAHFVPYAAPAAPILSLPYVSDVATQQTRSNIPQQVSLQMNQAVAVPQLAFLQHQAQEQRHSLFDARQSQRGIVNEVQSLDQFLMYQLLQDEAQQQQQQQLQNSLLPISPQFPNTPTRKDLFSIQTNIAPMAQMPNQTGNENDAVAHYIRELFQRRPENG